MTDRLLPQSPDAERGVLSSFLLSPLAVGALCAEKRVTAQHFAHAPHDDIFRALMELWLSQSQIDFITLTQHLRDASILDRCGGAVFVTELFTYLPTAANVGNYLEILEEKRQLREIITRCTSYVTRAFGAQDEVGSILADATSGLGEIGVNPREEVKPWKSHIIEKLERMETGDPRDDVLVTGIKVLDEHSPLRLGSMPLISGEAKAGKSILAIAISANVAAAGHGIIYFSLEDPARKIVDRFFANVSQVPTVRHYMENMQEGDMPRFKRACEELKKWRFVLRCDVQDLSGIVAVTRQTKAQMPELALCVVDYAQLVRGGRQKGDSRETEVASVSRALRLLSIELNIATLVLCQLNKDGDTRESTSLEKDMTAMWKISVPDDETAHNKRFITIPRQRDGESGVGRAVAFFGAQSRIENLVEVEEPPQPKKKK